MVLSICANFVIYVNICNKLTFNGKNILLQIEDNGIMDTIYTSKLIMYGHDGSVLAVV